MRLRLLGFAGLLSIALGMLPVTAVSAAARSDPPVLQIDGLGKGSQPVGGEWQFHTGDNADWAAKGFDDSGWERIAVERTWGRQGHEDYTGFAWYRRHLQLETGPDLALLMPHLDDVYEVYWNGVRIGGEGKFPPYPTWYYAALPRRYELGLAADGVLAIRVWKAPLLSDDSGLGGGFAAAPVLGTSEAISGVVGQLQYKWLRGRQFTFAECLLFGLIGLFSLLGWVRDRRQWLLFWMSGFSLAPVAKLLIFGGRLHWPVQAANAMGQPVSSISDISLWFLLLWLLELRGSRPLLRLVKVCAVLSLTVTVLDGFAATFDWQGHLTVAMQVGDGVLTGLYYVTAAMPLVLVGFAVTRTRRLDSTRWLVAIAAFLSWLVQLLQGAAPQGRRFTHWTFPDRVAAPLVVVAGNSFNAGALSATLLLLVIAFAVFRNLMESRRRQVALEQELESARELQQVLIPETLPAVPGFALTSAYRPAQEVGGDFFQIIPINERETLILLGDVSGKGLKAAMAVSLLVGVIRALAGQDARPAQLLKELNRCLYGRLQGGFTTCVVLLVNARGGCVAASAGHPAPYLNGREIEMAGALPLGLVADLDYPETSLALTIGDRLALSTDGLLEARNAHGELYGFQRMQALFATRPSALEATEAAVEFGQDDDITVVILTRVRSSEESSVLHTAKEIA